MTKMFTYNGRRMTTWNLFTGCDFNCSYCWARKLAEGKLRKSYPNGFVPTVHPDRFNKRFHPDDFVFPVSMGDIAFAPSVVEDHVVATANKYPETKFLLCSKKPDIFRKVKFHLPNVYLGTTLETNREYGVTRASPPLVRYLTMWNLTSPHKFVSIEPLMDFDLLTFVRWIGHIKPEIIEVGADNYRNNLPEPSADKVNALLVHLRKICPVVIEKQGLERVLLHPSTLLAILPLPRGGGLC